MRSVFYGGLVGEYDFPQFFGNSIAGIGNAFHSVGLESKYANINDVAVSIDELASNPPDIAYINIVELHRAVIVAKGLAGKTFMFVETDGVDTIMDMLPYETKIMYFDVMKSADVVIANSPRIAAKLKMWTDTPIEQIGGVIDVPEIAKWYDGSRDKKYIMHGPLTKNRYSRDVVTGMMLATRLGIPSMITATPNDVTMVEQMIKDLQINGVVMPSICQEHWYRDYLSQCKFGIALATATTLGRVAGDCAAVGIPCIGTPNLYQQSLFPELTIRWSDPEQIMVSIARLEANSFWDHIIVYATDKIRDYSVESIGKKLMQLYERYK